MMPNQSGLLLAPTWCHHNARLQEAVSTGRTTEAVSAAVLGLFMQLPVLKLVGPTSMGPSTCSILAELL